MKILSVDTSSNICSVAILNNETILYEKSLANTLTHSENLMPMIQEALQHINISLEEIDLFACSKGPGSFTGIRIGVSTIKAFSDVYPKPAMGISSLEGLVYNISNSDVPFICPLIDAKHSNVYAALFSRTENTYLLKEKYIADSIENYIEFLKQNYMDQSILFIGDGAETYKEIIKNYFPTAQFVKDSSLNLPNSVSIGKAAYSHYLKKEASSLSPMYLKKSQAERAITEKNIKEN